METEAPKRFAFKEQVGALPYRRATGGGLSILLITSRDSGRWIIPKGWPIEGRTGAEAAATEAYEEAGLEGEAEPRPLGWFDYLKTDIGCDGSWCRVTVFSFHVRKQLSKWPEKGERTLRWFDPLTAAIAADDQGLSVLIRRFAERSEGPTP